MLQLPRTILRAGINRIRVIAGADPLDDTASLRGELKQAGQIVVIFTLMLTVLIGLIGIAIDTTYAWRESLRVQRAADAAALAGVVYMPGALTTAQNTAKAAATRNGFPVVSGPEGTAVLPVGATNPRELDVTITTHVPTFFSRIFGIDSFAVSRLAKAIYVTPVPMGSPLAYLGVYQLCNMSDVCIAQPTTLAGGGTLGVTTASQGFFATIEGQGGNSGNGDAYSTYYDGKPTLSSQYNSDGYRYTVEGGASAGTLYIFDPEFCATASKTTGSGHAGAGDHWLGTPGPVSTYYILWDTHNLPLAPGLWTKVATDNESNEYMADKGTTYGGSLTTYADGGATASAATDCQASSGNDPKHNKWWAFNSISANETYSLQVVTTDPSSPLGNTDEMQQNMFSLAVTGGGRVYGTGAMETYNNVTAGSAEFYLAQIDRTAGAGKTIEIDIFDPGDTSSPSWIQIEPDGTPAWVPTTFSYSSSVRNGSGVNCIQVRGGTGTTPPSGCTENYTTASTFWNDKWVALMVNLPTTYGDASHPLSNSGWWKIKYTVNQGNDVITWGVSIRGNPVHLI